MGAGLVDFDLLGNVLWVARSVLRLPLVVEFLVWENREEKRVLLLRYAQFFAQYWGLRSVQRRRDLVEGAFAVGLVGLRSVLCEEVAVQSLVSAEKGKGRQRRLMPRVVRRAIV